MMGDLPVLSVQQSLTQNGMTTMPYPPCSPDLAPSDFFVSLIKKIKMSSKENIFADVRDMKQKTAETLKGIKIEEFKKLF